MTRLRQPSFAIAVASILLASCRAGDRSAHETGGAKVIGNAVPAELDVTSNAFRSGQPIPAQYTCDGADRSPGLQWSEPPAATRSLAIIVDDPDAPGGLFRHWGAFDIPPSSRSLAAGQAASAQAVNDFGKTGYGGPCPPRGNGPHHFRFKLFALDTGRLGLPAGARIINVETAARRHALAEGELIGTYERK